MQTKRPLTRRTGQGSQSGLGWAIGFQSAVADTDSSFERLQALRRDDMISARREVGCLATLSPAMTFSSPLTRDSCVDSPTLPSDA